MGEGKTHTHTMRATCTLSRQRRRKHAASVKSSTMAKLLAVLANLLVCCVALCVFRFRGVPVLFRVCRPLRFVQILLAARIIAAVENPEDVVVVSSRQFGQRSVFKFAQVGPQPQIFIARHSFSCWGVARGGLCVAATTGRSSLADRRQPPLMRCLSAFASPAHRRSVHRRPLHPWCLHQSDREALHGASPADRH